jgi:hypothetical protein
VREKALKRECDGDLRWAGSDLRLGVSPFNMATIKLVKTSSAHIYFTGMIEQ